MSTSAEPILSVQGLATAIGAEGPEILSDVSLQVAPGEVLGVVGESGSGKSMLALSIMGLLPHPIHVRSGRILLQSQDLATLPAARLRAMRGKDMAMIFQEPMTSLNPVMRVGQQLAEVLHFKLGMDARAARTEGIALLRRVELPEPERRIDAYPHELSGGQRQRVMIAMALAGKPRLLIADEPTTALDVTIQAQILELVRRIQRDEGMAVLLITHDLNLVRRFADRVAVMERGLLVEQGAVADVFAAPQHPYTQMLLASRPERDVVEAAVVSAAPPVLQARQMRVSYPVPLPGIKGWFKKGAYVAVQGADLDLAPGQTLGVMGESGSGKSTLALAALGLLPHQGSLQVTGTDWAEAQRTGQSRSLRQRIQVVFQDPFSSLSPRMTIEQIVGEGLLVHEPELRQEQRRQRVVAALAEVGLVQDPTQAGDWLQRYPHEFSGGQRQRLAIARALIVGPQVLVLDEPTSALDVTVQKQVLALLQRLQRERGLSYLLITHDVDVIRAMAHDVLVMKDGQVVEHGLVQQVLQQPAHPYTRTLVQAAA